MTCKLILLPIAQVLLVCEPELDHRVFNAWHSSDSISNTDYAFETAELQDIF